MKHYRKCAILLLLLMTLGCNKHDQKTENKALKEEQLLSTLDEFNKAFAESDLVALDSMVTDNYLHTNSSSKAIGKSDWFNYLNKRNTAIESGLTEVLDYQLEETKIEYHGDAALVTGKVIVRTKDSLGVRQSQYRITNLWVHDEGRWKRAGFHDGKID